MAVNEEYKEYIDAQLCGFPDWTAKKMFGGIGYFRDKKMFGGIFKGIFRLKVNDSNRADFEKYNMGPWEVPGKKMKMPYYEVPEEIIANQAALKQWAQKAYEVAILEKKK